MITIPKSIWDAMLAEFAKEKRAVEQVCYFDGVVLGDIGVVTTLTIPCAILEAGRFHVPPDAMSEAGKHLRKWHLRRLAQVHTHPAEWTGHSAWDNEWAYSQQPGAISIVLPHLGRRGPRLEHAGVHLRTSVGWQQLAPEDVSRHLCLVPNPLDFRKSNEPARVEPPRRRPWWAVLAFWGR